MKKLYFLDEEEKNRILNIHEGATKKQYLSEDKVGDYWKTLDPKTSSKFASINGGAGSPGTDEDMIIKGVNLLTKNEFLKLQELFKTIGMAGYNSFESMVNGEFEKDNWNYVSQIVKKLQSIGINATAIKDNINDFRVGSFNITTQPVTQQPTTQQPVAKQPVTQQPVGKKPAVVNPKVAYQQRAQQVNQQTINTTKEIQKLLGQEPTGNLDATYVEKVIDLLKQ